jgi:hypothetical protein
VFLAAAPNAKAGDHAPMNERIEALGRRDFVPSAMLRPCKVGNLFLGQTCHALFLAFLRLAIEATDTPSCRQRLISFPL